MQLMFFLSRRKSLHKVPQCIRSTTIVKAGGDLSHSKLKGAIAPEEFIYSQRTGDDSFRFLDIDPRDGFSVRNFQIQAAKIATLSDIVVYGDDMTPREDVMRLAERISKAQKAWREKDRDSGLERPLFNTFLILGESLIGLHRLVEQSTSNPTAEPFSRIEKNHPEIVAIDGRGDLTHNIVDFCEYSCAARDTPF